MCCVRYSTQSYKVVSGCDMHWIVSCKPSLQSWCMHLLISMLFISAGQEEPQTEKQHRAAALHIPHQTTVHFRVLVSHAWQQMLNNHRCLPFLSPAQFAMRECTRICNNILSVQASSDSNSLLLGTRYDQLSCLDDVLLDGVASSGQPQRPQSVLCGHLQPATGPAVSSCASQSQNVYFSSESSSLHCKCKLRNAWGQ